MAQATSQASFPCAPQSDLNSSTLENIGKEYIDQVTIADGLVIPQQSIGVVEEVGCMFYFKFSVFLYQL